jgi:hypothetical protein
VNFWKIGPKISHCDWKFHFLSINDAGFEAIIMYINIHNYYIFLMDYNLPEYEIQILDFYFIWNLFKDTYISDISQVYIFFHSYVFLFFV